MQQECFVTQESLARAVLWLATADYVIIQCIGHLKYIDHVFWSVSRHSLLTIISPHLSLVFVLFHAETKLADGQLPLRQYVELVN